MQIKLSQIKLLKLWKKFKCHVEQRVVLNTEWSFVWYPWHKEKIGTWKVSLAANLELNGALILLYPHHDQDKANRMAFRFYYQFPKQATSIRWWLTLWFLTIIKQFLSIRISAKASQENQRPPWLCSSGTNAKHKSLTSASFSPWKLHPIASFYTSIKYI